ncbi:MAG: polysulfide reductase NrfD [Anaerolineales bacterium]|nr:polysulfide reductase NrfD [Anaerolineales bacterium]MCB9128301.1 polysulfide reductase NrfD [Ardenticatenales bacterium]MCB9172092.1 polysulfide reductase NrfD [Ardenticatenales bacterium]
MPNDHQPPTLGDYPTYYDKPALKSGHWRWLIIGYFWAGGMAGGSYLLAMIAHLFGDEADRPIARWGRYIAVVMGAVVSPVLLIWDLGKPSRFYNMLRIFKPRSPMSVGTWGLLTFSFFSGMSAFLQAARDGLLRPFGPLARLGKTLPFIPFESIGAFFGLFMSGYTGVLLSNATVPLWAKSYKTKGATFLSSALATASAAITLLMALTDNETPRAIRRLHHVQRGAMIVEGALIAHEVHHLGPLRGYLLRGKVAPHFYSALLCGLVLPLLMRSPRSRAGRILKALLTLVGGFLYRTSAVMGGHASAEDPQAIFYHSDPRRD